MEVSVLTKVPRPGRVKTRLVKTLGEEGAASLHEAMASDVGVLLKQAGVAATWHVEGPLDHAWTGTLPGPVRPQVGGDLGARIQAALGDEGGLALGIDAPTLPEQLLRQAIQSQAEVILGPAFDGGCWCIGQSRHHPGWLSEMTWSHGGVCAELVQRARTRGLSIDLLPYWADVDESDDLQLLQQQLRILPETAAPHTRRWLTANPEHTWHT